MTIIIKRPVVPVRKMSASQSVPGTRTPPSPALERAAAPRIGREEESRVEDVGNMSRIRAGATAGENGFTCVRCLQWFPAGTQHACRPYADVIRNKETQAPTKGPMSAEEIQLLQQDGQL